MSTHLPWKALETNLALVGCAVFGRGEIVITFILLSPGSRFRVFFAFFRVLCDLDSSDI